MADLQCRISSIILLHRSQYPIENPSTGVVYTYLKAKMMFAQRQVWNQETLAGWGNTCEKIFVHAHIRPCK
jgi:hypothetical protein